MKKLLLLAIVVLSASCTSVKYTHHQVMDRYDSKSKITAKFGVPTSKSREGNIEQWYYNFGQVTRSGGYTTNGSSNSNISVNGNIATVRTTYTPATVTNWTRTYTRYLIVMFDQRGNVVNWKSKGLDYTVREKDPKKTILTLLGTAAATGIIISSTSTKEFTEYEIKN